MTAPTLATPATTVNLRTLPVDPDEGFPQSFLLGVDDAAYRVELHVNVPEHMLDRRAAPRTPLVLVGSANAPAQGMLVATLIHQSHDGRPVQLLRRRLLPGLLYTAGELALVVDELRIAMGNLNGTGPFGSVLRARAGVR